MIPDRQAQAIAKAVLRLIFNLFFVFYNGILGLLSSSPIFVTSAVYYLLLSAMGFSVVFLQKKGREEQQSLAITGVMLIILSIVFHIMVIISMRYKTAAVYGTIPMITIAAFTFTKITAAAIAAARHWKKQSILVKTINTMRYSEIAVSLLTMQQSMLASFGDGNAPSSVILNACTGAGVCFFILTLGIITLKKSKKEPYHG